MHSISYYGFIKIYLIIPQGEISDYFQFVDTTIYCLVYLQGKKRPYYLCKIAKIGFAKDLCVIYILNITYYYLKSYRNSHSHEQCLMLLISHY